MEFKVLTLDDCLEVAKWRNETLNALRTPYGLTQEQQADFYHNVVCDRKANARYWGIWSERNKDIITVFGTYIETIREIGLIGMAGIENIEWENRRGEISLILDPNQRGNGAGVDALKMLLDKGFNELNLNSIWGLCYECNPASSFWQREVNRYQAFTAILPDTKFYQGKYWRGFYFSFNRGDYAQTRNN